MTRVLHLNATKEFVLFLPEARCYEQTFQIVTRIFQIRDTVQRRINCSSRTPRNFATRCEKNSATGSLWSGNDRGWSVARTEERQGVTERELGAVTIQCRPRDDLHSYQAARREIGDPSHRRFRSTSFLFPPLLPALLWIHVIGEQRFHRLRRLLLDSGTTDAEFVASREFFHEMVANQPRCFPPRKN